MHRLLSQFLAHALTVVFVFLATPTRAQELTNYGHFEGRQTHPIALTPNAERLLALNTSAGRLSVFDATTPTPVLLAEIPVGLEPVSVRARTDDEAWLVNEVSDSVSIVSLTRGLVAVLRAPDEPADVIFAGEKAFVSCARNNLLRIFDVTTREQTKVVPLQGLYPRALAVDAAGSKVFVAFQLSGNGSTILPASEAPAQPAKPELPAPPRTGMIVSASDERIRHRVLDHDVAEISAIEGRVLGYYSGLGTNHFDVAVHPLTGELWLANTEARNLVRFEPALRGHFADHRLSRVRVPQGTVTIHDLNPGIDYATLPNSETRDSALSQPTAIVFEPSGDAWVAAFASDRVAKVSAEGAVLARIDTRTGLPNDSRHMRGPRGLALDAKRGRLYTLNKLANTITIIDTAEAKVLGEIPVSAHDPMPKAVREGRGFLFDARLSGNGTGSCAVCHLDADRDGLAWDLGDPSGQMQTLMGANLAIHDTTLRERRVHPMKGPMLTQTLRGMQNGAPFHWRGDRATLQDFNPTFDKLMGGQELGRADIDALAEYLMTLRHHPNPNRNLDRTLPAEFMGGQPEAGRVLFNIHNNHCSICHTLPRGSDNNLDDFKLVGAGQPIKTPPLGTLYQRAFYDPRPDYTSLSGFGFNHDGAGHVLPTVHFYELDQLRGQDFADLTAFLLCFDTGTAPIVGQDRVVTAENSAMNADDLALLERLARAGHCDLVAEGKLAGAPTAWLYDKALSGFRRAGQGEILSAAALTGQLAAGDALRFLALLPGEGIGHFDFGQETKRPPVLSITPSDNGFLLRWPESDALWLPESNPNLAVPWEPLTDGVRLEDGVFRLEAPRSENSQFFRLRRAF